MNQENEASSSSPPSPRSVVVGFLQKECNQLRDTVDSAKSLETLTFYSRLTFTAFEAIKTLINKFNANTLGSEADEIENSFVKACDIIKEIRIMFSDAISRSSSTSDKRGSSKKILTWKNQCGKNIENIELLIKQVYLDSSTNPGTFAFYAMHYGISAVFPCLYNILKYKATGHDQDFRRIAEGILQTFEKFYRDIVSRWNYKGIRERIKYENDLLGELNLKNPQEGAIEKTQEEEMKKLTEDQGLKNLPGKNIKMELQQEGTLMKLQQEEEMKVQEALKKLVEETQKNSEEREVKKKAQEEEALKKSQEEKNSADEILKVGRFTFKMRNGVLERVLE